MNRKLFENAFVHQETKTKLEVALLVSSNKSRTIIDAINYRIRNMEVKVENWYEVPLHLRKLLKKLSSYKHSE